MRRNDEDLVKKSMEIRVEGKRSVGRPRKIWLNNVQPIWQNKRSIEKTQYRKTDYRPILLYYTQMSLCDMSLLVTHIDQYVIV